MSNIFTPERQANESQVEYRIRRKAAKASMQRMALRGPFAAFGGINQRRQMRDSMDMQKRVRAADVIMNYFTEKRLEAMNAKKAQQSLTQAA